MYIRIQFENLESEKTKETQDELFGSPNGMFLTSSYAFMITTKEMREKVGTSVVFWYLDISTLNKHYGGVLNCLNQLLTYSGVSRVDILPIEGKQYENNYDEFITNIMEYL